MEKVKNISKKKKIIIAILAGILLTILAVALIVIYTMSQNSKEIHMSSDSLYMEETVEVKDIIVGLSESATATLLYTEIQAEYGMEVEEIYVVSGQTVKEGDIIAKVNLDDYTKESVSEELENAQLDLEKLELENEIKLVQASNSLNTTSVNGENAKTIYNLAVAEIESGLSDIDDDIDSIEEQIESIEYQIANGLTDDCGVYEAEAEVTATKEKIAEIENQIATTQEDIAPLQAELDLLNTQLVELELAYQKASEAYSTAYSNLEKELSTLQAQYSSKTTERTKYLSTMETQKAQALATYNLTTAEYSTAQDTYDVTVAELNSAVEKAEELVEGLEEKLAEEEEVITEETTLIYDEEGNIYAPVSGYIMTAEENNQNMENISPLTITIADSQQVELSLSISQDDIADIEVGMDVSVVFDSYEDTPIKTTVESVEITSSSLMTSSVNYTVTIMCDVPTNNEGETLVVYQGMTATATLVLKQAEDVLAVSTKCITIEDAKEYATLLIGEDELQKVEVSTGFSDGFDVEITSGLNEGDIVIIESAVSSSAY